MLTQCSQCKKNFSLGIEDLRTRPADLFCPQCDEMLGKLKTFNSDFLNSRPRYSYGVLWFIAVIAGIALFGVQLYLLEGDKFIQHPERRAWLEKICQYSPWPCQLPVYKNLDEFEILHGDFRLQDNHYEFQTVLSNQSEFKQPYPHIKLTLLDFNGHIFAERTFEPHEYLSGESTTELMPASETIEVHLHIALPAQKVGGYTFELL